MLPAGLEFHGEPAPVERMAIDDSERRDGVTWPGSLRELLEAWGPGVLGGRFRVLAPGELRHRELVAFTRGQGAHHHARGYWKRGGCGVRHYSHNWHYLQSRIDK